MLYLFIRKIEYPHYYASLKLLYLFSACGRPIQQQRNHQQKHTVQMSSNMWGLALLSMLATVAYSHLTFPVSSDTVSNVATEIGEIAVREWNNILPKVDRLETDMAICDVRLANQQAICEECAERVCTEDEKNAIDLICYGAIKLVKKVTDKIKDIGKDVVGDLKNLGNKVKDRIKDIGKGIKDIGKGIGKGIKKVGEKTVDAVKKIGKGIEKGVKKIGKGIEKGVKKVAEKIKDIGKGIGKSVRKVLPRIRRVRIRVPRIRFRFRRWGKKKRSIDVMDDDEDPVSDLILRDTGEECMSMCSSCKPFLEDPSRLTSSICGNELLELNGTVSLALHKLKVLRDHVAKEDNNLLVTSINYDPTSYDNNKGGFTRVDVNAFFEGGFRTFKSEVAYNAAASSDYARLVAGEYWKLFLKA